MKELIAKSGQDTYAFGQLSYNGHFISAELCTNPLNEGEKRTLDGWNTLLAGTDKKIPDTELLYQQMRRLNALRNNEKYWGEAEECREGLRRTFEKHWQLMLSTRVDYLGGLEATISHLGIEPRTSGIISIPEFPEQNNQCSYLLLALQRPADLPVIGHLQIPKVTEELISEAYKDGYSLGILLMLLDEADLPCPPELGDWLEANGIKNVEVPTQLYKEAKKIVQRLTNAALQEKSANYARSMVPEPEALREKTNPMLEALLGEFAEKTGEVFQYCASRCSGPAEMMRAIRIWTPTKAYRKAKSMVTIGSDDTGSGELGFGLSMTLPEDHPMPAVWVRKLED